MSISHPMPHGPTRLRSALRAWTMGPLPQGAPEERWSLPEVVVPPDDERYTRRRSQAGNAALLLALFGVLGFSVAWSDPWGRGWNAHVAGVTRRAEPLVDRAVTAIAAALP
jgi:hypothetical protein